MKIKLVSAFLLSLSLTPAACLFGLEDCAGVLGPDTVDYPLHIEHDRNANPFLGEVWFTCKDTNENHRKDCPGLGGGAGDRAELCTPSPNSQCEYRRAHVGIDLNWGSGNQDYGLTFYSIGPGRVTLYNPSEPGFGKVVIVTHTLEDGQKVNSLYGHMARVDVHKGDCVSSATQIGTIGDGDGRWPSAHLHLELRPGLESTKDLENGYAFLHESSILDRYTDPYAFIDGLRASRQAKLPARMAEPAFFFPLCQFDEGTTATNDDESSPCLNFTRSERMVFGEVFLDGAPIGRSYGGTIPVRQSLIPGKHHWRIDARNFFGVTRGPTWEFTISAGGLGGSLEDPATSAITEKADNISETRARLTGKVIPYGSRTEFFFEYGSSTSYGHTTPIGDVGSGYRWTTVARTIRNLLCDNTYHYRVIARDARGVVMPGADQKFTTDDCSSPSAHLPPAVNLALEGAECGKISLHWNIEEAGHYDLFRDDVQVWENDVADTDGTQEFADDEMLVPGEGYDYRIRAVNEFGESTDDVHVFYPPYICGGFRTPSTEFILQVTPQLQRCDGSSPAVLLEWTPLDDSDTLYRVYKADGTLQAEVDAAKDGPVYVLREGLVPGQSYSFYVEGYDYQGNAVRSNSTTVYITSDRCQIGGSPAVAPGDFLVWHEPVTCVEGVPQVRLRWTASAGAQSYRVERSREDLTISVNNIYDTSYLDVDRLKSGSFHIYNIFAVNASGETQAYPTRMFVPSDICGDVGLPGDFLLYVEEPYCANGKPTIRHNWFPAEGNINPLHGWLLTNGTASGSVNTTHLGFTKYTHEIDAGLSAGNVFGIFMQVEDAADPSKSRESNVVTFSIPKDICGPRNAPPLAQTQAARGVRTDAALLFGAVNPNGTNTTAYFEWGLTTSYGNSTVARVVGDGMSYLYPGVYVTGLSCGTSYHYRVVGTNAFGTTYGDDQGVPTVSCPNTAPTFSFVEPNGVGDEADGSFIIKWSDSDPDSSAVISLSYSANATCSAPTVIGGSIPEDDSANVYAWNTGAIADGTYYLLASIADGIAPAVTRCSQSGIAVTHSTTFVRILSQGAAGAVGKDIWTTSVYSYAPGGNTPGGGLDDHELLIGGWGDSYFGLLQFDLAGLPQQAVSAYLELFCFGSRSGVTTGLYLDQITAPWDWRTQGTGRDRDRLWWANRPPASPWITTQLAAPQAGQWYRINITSLYNAWQAGTPNYGLQLRPASTSNKWSEFYSANYVDNPPLRPRLVVTANPPLGGHPTFTRGTDMVTPRQMHCAAKLGNGKVLIAGGYGTGTSNPLSSAELYDPTTRTFTPTGSMNVSRGRPQCVTLSDGRVLVGGGATAPFKYTNSAQVYNPTTGTFTAVGNMTTPRGEGWHAFAIPGGALLFGGTYEGAYGTATAAVDRFDAGSNSFSRVGTLAGARRDYTAQMLSDGTTLLVGGVLRFDLPVSLAAELYNVSTNQPISIGQPNHTARVRSWSSAALPGGDVLVTSGAGFPSEIYRRVTHSFEALNGAPSLYAGDFASAVSLSDGKVLLLGYGRASGQGGRIAEIFDPVGGTFTAVGSMAFPSECQGYTVTTLNDGKVLITGGGTPGNCGQGTRVAEIFSPNGL